MKRLRHGMHNTPTYKSWQAMKERCCNPKATKYPRYGGRGITVCERWRTSFENFLEDMGERPAGKTLERSNNAGNYEPGNCVWATGSEQQNNTSVTAYIEFNGRTQTRAAWAAELGIAAYVIKNRIAKGWTIQAALTTPTGKWGGR